MTTFYFNLENIYKLSTPEDKTLFHKFLGGVCLVNFIYRYIHYILFGNMDLNNPFSIFLIGVHGLLSISSLIFHIPSKRNPSKPMIYPEFRLHSIAFALRSVIICYQYYYKLHYIYPIITCYVTMISADLITYHFNPDGKNGKTMRNMPFDNDIPIEKQDEIIRMHSIMQIGATTFMLEGIESAFSPLLAIQLAAFLMTLVRKSIINAVTWHSVYTLTLWINMLLYQTHAVSFMIIHHLMIKNYIHVFFPYRINKYIGWSINFGTFIIYRETGVEDYINYISDLYPEFIHNLKLVIIVYALIHFYNKFQVLFIKA
jgi:hypothetical protein